MDYYASKYHISTDNIATIGDMPTDTSMFARSGLSIAMGNSSTDVQRSAKYVTKSNEKEGFAIAVDRFILSAAGSGAGDGE